MAINQPLMQSKQLFLLVAERLCLMQEVAHYKVVHHLPLYVPEVESKLLAQVVTLANSLGLSASHAQATIALQMRFARVIQQQWCEHKERTVLPAYEPKDLERVLRPQLNRLTEEILMQIAKAKSELADPTQAESLRAEYQQQLQVPFLSEQQKWALLESLIAAAKS